METTERGVTPTQALTAEMEMEAETTRRVLESVPEGRYDWRPHEKARSMGELCTHIAAAANGIPDMLCAPTFDLSDRPPEDEAPESKDALLALHASGVERMRSFFGSLGDELNDDWVVTMGDDEVMRMPRWMAIRWLLMNHVYHHRGQLAAYLRMAGERVPSIYGPSADESPFD